jgi:hypothetical protein
MAYPFWMRKGENVRQEFGVWGGERRLQFVRLARAWSATFLQPLEKIPSLVRKKGTNPAFSALRLVQKKIRLFGPTE